MKRRRLIFAMLALTAVVSSTRTSAEVVSFRGNLIEQPPCIINDDELITVNFGDDVMTTRIDGKNYMQDINFNLDCSNVVGNAPLKLRIAGTKASFAEALDGNRTGLGIALVLDGKLLKPNDWQTFSSVVKPVLQAVPVKEDSVILDRGPFRVLASLEMEYQ